MKLCVGHRKQRIDAPHKRCHRAECNQRIHIRRAVNQSLKSAEKEFLIDHHDDTGQQQLQQSHRNVIALQTCRKRPSPHHMSHGQIHQDNQKSYRGNQPPLELRCLPVGQHIGIRRRTLMLRAFPRGAVSCRFHRRDNLLRRCRTLHTHGIGQQTDRTGGHAGHLGYRLLHPRAACGTAHTGHGILLHIEPSFISSIFEAPRAGRQSPHRVRPEYPARHRCGYGWTAALG